MTHSSQQPPPVALAATVLLLREAPLQVLMMKRRAGAVFASAWVFPGGIVEPQDADESWLGHLTGGVLLSPTERALRIAGCREVFEETGVLLCGEHAGGFTPRAGESFLELVRRQQLRLDLDALIPFGHWITPENAPKRFDTHFFVCAAPAEAAACADGKEAVTVEWIAPTVAVADVGSGAGDILFPTLMNLRRLAQSADVAGALHSARTRPPFTVVPQFEERADGRVIVISERAGYSVTEHPASANYKLQIDNNNK